MQHRMNSGNNNNNNKAKGRPKKEATSSAAVKSLAMQFLAGKIGTTRKTRRAGEREKGRGGETGAKCH